MDETNELGDKAKARCSLLSILPKPKNSSKTGATIQIDKLLKMPERANGTSMRVQADDDDVQRIGEDGMVEVDVSKVVTDPTQSSIKDLTIEASHAVILPKGKERQKNQITYLAKLGKATEIERKDQAALGRLNKAAARSKYGW